MTIHLTPELERWIQDKIRTGRYNSASEVVREALQLLERFDDIREMRIQEMRGKVQEGWDSLRRGEGADGEQFIVELALGLDEREKSKKAQ